MCICQMGTTNGVNMDIITKTDTQEDWISPFTGIIDD